MDPRVLLPIVQHHCAALNELALLSLSPATRWRVQSLAAEATTLLGWQLYLAGDRSASDTCYALALDMARDIRDDETSGFALVARSFLHSQLFGASRDESGDLIRTLDEAVELSGRTSSPYLQAFASRRRAEERSLRGDPGDAAGAQHDLDNADTAFSSARGRHDGFYHYTDQGRQAGTRGTCAILLGNVDEAISVLSQVLSTTPPSLAAERSTLVTDLAAAYAQRGEVEYSCDLLGRSLSLGHLDVNRVRRIVGVRKTHLSRWASAPSVKLLDEELRIHVV